LRAVAYRTIAAELAPGRLHVARELACVLGYEDGGVRMAPDGFEVHAFVGLGRPAFFGVEEHEGALPVERVFELEQCSCVVRRCRSN
jgi:hypothetical protein